jgi:hypothetical protein
VNAPTRLGVFALAAAAAFGGGAALGAVAGPEPEPEPPAHVEHDAPATTPSSVTIAPMVDAPHEPGVTHP